MKRKKIDVESIPANEWKPVTEQDLKNFYEASRPKKRKPKVQFFGYTVVIDSMRKKVKRPLSRNG